MSVKCTDPWVTNIIPSVLSFYDISPGEVQSPKDISPVFRIWYNPSTFPGTFHLKFELGIDGHVSWTYSSELMLPPAQPTAGTPVHNADSVSRRPTFTWSPVVNADKYRLQVSTNDVTLVMVVDTVIWGDTTWTLAMDLASEASYLWCVSAGNLAGWGDPSPLKAFVTGTTDVEHSVELPTVYALGQNYPNPFNPTTVVSSQLPVASDVKLIVYDVLGREVAILVNERRAAGYYQDTFDASGLASGVYVYRLTAGSYVESREMVLLK